MESEREILLTRQEVISMLRVSENTIRRYVREGRLVEIRLPGVAPHPTGREMVRYRVRDVHNFLQELESDAAAESKPE